MTSRCLVFTKLPFFDSPLVFGRNSRLRPVLSSRISTDPSFEIIKVKGQVSYGSIRRNSALPRPPCDDTPSASVWPSPRRTPEPPCPYPNDRTHLTNHEDCGRPSAWTSPRIPTRKNPMGGILRRESCHMPKVAWLVLPTYAADVSAQPP